MVKKEKIDYEAQFIREYEHWEHFKKYGGSDPNYDDSVNMNLTRNHIIYYKNEMKNIFIIIYGVGCIFVNCHQR